ncbi:hypothetical protein FSP39_019643 [Pinctada imbricata]|uniref:Endoglucanase n=1 Tax=Pinctada imbricata TaxID=66713 RepID=A0AA89C1R0_PINIB|nr:hypothetical protein FSP39_019643 [Pinctada imbricata]
MKVLVFLALIGLSYGQLKVVSKWNNGLNGEVTVHTDSPVNNWKAHVIFSHPVKMAPWTSEVVSTAQGGKEVVLHGKSYNHNAPAGDMKLGFTISYGDGEGPPTACAYFEGQSNSCGGGGGGSSSGGNTGGGGGNTGGGNTGGGGGGDPITAAPATHCTYAGGQTKYDYGQALGLSILFYDAQRSGRLPSNNPIPWRGDSAVDDHGDNGVDLSGGWYDAGDLVKFNFPMAWASHTLLWGLNKFKDGYEAAGQLDMMYDMIKWPLEYFLKCWRPNEQVYYAQVGDGYEDHKIWQRPEDMHMNRPAYKITASKPGSDVCGQTAAAMAAGAVAFKTKDAGFSQKLVASAKTLYEFAKAHRGHYSDSIPAKDFYGSTSDADDLCLAAVELFFATGDQQYLSQAKGFYAAGTAWAFSWDDNKVACQLLLYEATKDSKYTGDVKAFVNQYKDGGSVQHTPCGLAWRDQWGSLRYAGNAAYIALAAAADGIGGDDYKTFAVSQINYALGDNRQHMSFEIGFGNNFPRKPHHKASSCNAGCSWNEFNSGAPNPHILKGALVGGPGSNDDYNDDRKDFAKNEVACDYNAGFQSALAGLEHFNAAGALPASPGAKC